MRKSQEDAYWDAMLERLDMDASEMAEAERRLQEVGEERLADEQVEAIVEQTSARSRMRALPGVPTRRLSVAAAALIAFFMTTGLTAITVVVIHLLWSEGTNSSKTMPYALAIKVLAHPEQPENPDKMAAMSTADERVKRGIGVLKGIRDDASSPPSLVDAVVIHLARLRELIVSKDDRDQAPVDETLDSSSAIRAEDATLGIQERLELVDHIADLTASGITGIRDVVNPTAELMDTRDKVLRRILADIDRKKRP